MPGASAGSARQLHGDTAHLGTKCLSSSTSPLLQETSPRDSLRALTFRVKDEGRRHYLDARIHRNQEQHKRGSLVEKQVLELSNLQTPIFEQCSDIWIKYLLKHKGYKGTLVFYICMKCSIYISCWKCHQFL